MRGHLKLVILSSLEEKDMSGSEIIEKIHKEFGWKPSCGSVYPVLNFLEEEKLAKVTSSGNKSHKKVYSLTLQGKSNLKKKKSQRQNLADEILRIHKMVASLYHVDTEKMEEMAKDVAKGKIPFVQVHREVEELKIEMFRISSEKLLEKNSEEVRKILRRTITELKKVRKQKTVGKLSITKKELSSTKKVLKRKTK